MWWNFVGRTHDDVVQAREAWQHGSDRFGHVDGDGGERLPAPELPNSTLVPRGNPAPRTTRSPRPPEGTPA